MEHLSHITRFGLPGIDRIPFGMHACHLIIRRTSSAHGARARRWVPTACTLVARLLRNEVASAVLRRHDAIWSFRADFEAV